MKIILGIDPGLAATGYGLIKADNSRQEHLQHGTINTLPDLALGERLFIIHQELARVIREYKPQEAAVESIYYAKNAKTVIPVAEARGVILLVLVQHGVPCFGYTPLEVKQAVLGVGRGEKDQIKEMVRILLKLSALPNPDHAADALALTICHHHHSHMQGLIARQYPDLPSRKARIS